MFIVGLLSWWYGAGWKRQCIAVKQWIDGMFDFFSISLLIKTYFSPFRQISAGNVEGNIRIQFKAFFDRLLSRIIGAVMRSIVIVFGSIVIGCALVGGLLAVVAWLLVPLVPLGGFTLAILGWTPWS